MKILKVILFLSALFCAAEIARAGDPDWDDAYRKSERANQEAWEMVQLASQLPSNFPYRQSVVSGISTYRNKTLIAFQQLEAIELGTMQPTEQKRQLILSHLHKGREVYWPAIREFLKDVEDEFDGEIEDSARQLRFKAWKVRNRMGRIVHELD